MVAYDTGALDAGDGTYTINFFAADDPSRPLLLGNLTVSELPRVASINSMLKGVELQTWQGLPIKPWKSERKLCEKNQNLTTDGCFVPLRKAQSVQVAALRQGRHIVQKYDGKCPPGLRAAAGSADASKGPDGNDCPNAGINVDLFPATMIYVTATVVDPNAKHWDPVSKSFVVGPLESRLFYQIAGRHPDLNRNGVDDFIDIATGKSKDTNGDGVPDEVQRCLKELGFWKPANWSAEPTSVFSPISAAVRANFPLAKKAVPAAAMKALPARLRPPPWHARAPGA